MGKIVSRPKLKCKDGAISDDWCVVDISTTGLSKNTVLEFDPSKSYAMCVGIDKQSTADFCSHNLGEIAAKEAVSIAESLVADAGLQKDRVRIYTPTSKSQLCTKDALGTLFVDYASEVEEGGIFIFHFSGHAVTLKGLDGKDEWVLAPADFKGDIKTSITAENFIEWLETAKCKARNVLIILDCCYAGGIGEKIASSEHLKPTVHVICACAAFEASLPMTALGSSIFSYFLLHVIKKYQPKGQFALETMMEEIGTLCQSFSSLLMHYTQDGVLKPKLIQPEVHSSSSSSDDVDSDNHNLNTLFRLYDQKSPKPSLHSTAIQWLRSASVQESLKALFSITPMPESLYDGIFCALLYSVSCFQLAYDRSHLAERNLFITAAISVVSAIGYSNPDVSITMDQLTLGLKYYYMPICSMGIQANPIEKLFLELHVREDGVGTLTADSQEQTKVSQLLLCFNVYLHIVTGKTKATAVAVETTDKDLSTEYT